MLTKILKIYSLIETENERRGKEYVKTLQSTPVSSHSLIILKASASTQRFYKSRLHCDSSKRDVQIQSPLIVQYCIR